MDSRVIDLNFNEQRPDRPIDTVQMKNDIDYYMTYLFELRKLKVKIEEFKSKLQENEIKMIETLNERLEVVEAILIRQNRLDIEYSTRGKGKYFNYDYCNSFEVINDDGSYSYIDTKKLADEIENFLDANRIPRKFFLMKMFKNEEYSTKLTSLLTNPIKWEEINDEDSKEKYKKMRHFLKNNSQKENLWNSFYYHENLITTTTTITKVPEVEISMPAAVSVKKPPPKVVSSFLDEFQLPIDFTCQVKIFLEKHKINYDLFSNSITNLSQRKLRYLFEKINLLIENEKKGIFKPSQLKDGDRVKLLDLSIWFNNVDRLGLFEKMKKTFLMETPGYKVPTNKKGRKKIGGKYEDDFDPKKPPHVKRPVRKSIDINSGVSVILMNIRNQDLLMCYYRANKYPTEDEFEEIAENTENSVEEVCAYYNKRNSKFRLLAITKNQYRHLYEYFYNINKKPTVLEVEEFVKDKNINATYVSRWMSKQRYNDQMMQQALKKKRNGKIQGEEDEATSVHKNDENELEKAFKISQYPDVDTVQRLKDELGLTMEQVVNWFKNKRKNYEKEEEEEEKSSGITVASQDNDESSSSSLSSSSSSSKSTSNGQFEIEYENE